MTAVTSKDFKTTGWWKRTVHPDALLLAQSHQRLLQEQFRGTCGLKGTGIVLLLYWCHDEPHLPTHGSTRRSRHKTRLELQGLAWLKENGRQVEGPLLGRYLASVHKDNLDYYEIWIPLQCS